MDLFNFTNLILIFISIYQCECQKSGWYCDDQERRLHDESIARLIVIGNSGRNFPENDGQEVKAFCNETGRLLNVIHTRINTCLRELPKQVSQVMTFTAKNELNKMCKGKSRKLYDLIDCAKCANTGNAEGLLGQAVEIGCGEFTDETDKCDKIGLPPKKKRSQVRPKSFAFPFINILDSIKEIPSS